MMFTHLFKDNFIIQVIARWVAKIYLDKSRRISRLIDIKEGIKDD